jgi:paraquat-inducible protein B
MKMTQTINGTERTFYLVDGETTTKIVKFEKDKQKRPVAVLPENSIGKLTFNLGKMIEENLTEVEISVTSSKMMREGTTPTTSTKTVKMSKIEELLKDCYPEIYEELERLAQIEALEAELKAQREIRNALKAQLEALKNPKVEEKTEKTEKTEVEA